MNHLNRDIPPECGWCGERGTIHHLFILCPAIQPALNLLHTLLSRLLPQLKLTFDIYWTLIPHAKRRDKEAVNLGNFLVVSLKNIIYHTYRTILFSDPLLIWTYRLKTKIILEHNYFNLLGKPHEFMKKWSINNSLFTTVNHKITWLI